MDDGPRSTCTSYWIDALWLFVLMAGSTWWCASASARVGVTYDEGFYLSAGLETWRDFHSWKLGLGGQSSDEPPPEQAQWWWGTGHRLAVKGVMPLPVDAVTFPLFLQELRTGVRIEDPLVHLKCARLVSLFWLALLLVSSLRLGRAVGGPWAGRVAAGLIAADPNFLAHATLATTDLCIAATLMALTRAVYAGRAGGWWGRVVLPGGWYGIAVLAKLSALLYGGLILVGLEVAYRFAEGQLLRPPGASRGTWALRIAAAIGRSIAAVAAVIVIGIVIATAYCSIPPPGIRPMSTVANNLTHEGDEELRPLYTSLEEYDRMPYLGVAFAFQWWHNHMGDPTFLNGTYYPKGCWYYFPVLIAMKLPLPVLLLGLLAILRPRGLLNPLTLIAVLLLAGSLPSHLQMGYRLILPVVAMGYVAVAVAVVRGWGRPGIWLGGMAVLALAATSAWVWPHGLCYLNQLSGGMEAARLRVSDSNCDWGQGMPDLAAWHRANSEPPTVIWYFGSDPAADRPPFQRLNVEALPITGGDDFHKAVGPRVLAVGATVMTMHPDEPPAKVVALECLKTLQPVARTATFTLYDFRNTPRSSK